MESNSKTLAFIVSEHQTRDYWAQFLLSAKPCPTGVFYQEGTDLPKMTQEVEDLPTHEVIWLDALMIENGFAKSVPIKRRPGMLISWLEEHNLN